MAKLTQSLLRRRGIEGSALATLCLAAVLVAQALLGAALSWLQVSTVDSTGSTSSSYDLGQVVPPVSIAVIVPLIAFCLGYFLSLWMVAPIGPQLRLGHVITRSLLASGMGAATIFLVATVQGLASAFGFGGSAVGAVLAWPSFDATVAGAIISGAFVDAILRFISLFPLGVLAGVLLWIWLSRRQPRHPIAGMVDEV